MPPAGNHGALTSEGLPVDVTQFGHSLYHAYVDYCRQTAGKWATSQGKAWIPKMSLTQLTNMLSDLALMAPQGPVRPQSLSAIFTRTKPPSMSQLTFGTFLQAIAAISREAEVPADAVYAAIATLAVERPWTQRPATLVSVVDDAEPTNSTATKTTQHKQKPQSATNRRPPVQGTQDPIASDKLRFQNLAPANLSASGPLDIASRDAASASQKQAWLVASPRMTGESSSTALVNHMQAEPSAATQQVPAWAQQLMGRLWALEMQITSSDVQPTMHVSDGSSHVPLPAQSSADDKAGSRRFSGSERRLALTKVGSVPSQDGATPVKQTVSAEASLAVSSTAERLASLERFPSQDRTSGQPLRPSRPSQTGSQPPMGSMQWAQDLLAQFASLKAVAEEAVQQSKQSQAELDRVKSSQSARKVDPEQIALETQRALQPTLDAMNELITRVSDRQQATEAGLASTQVDLDQAIESRIAKAEAGMQARLTTVNTTCSTLSAQVAAVAHMAKSNPADDSREAAQAAEATAQSALDAANAAMKELQSLQHQVAAMEEAVQNPSQNEALVGDNHSTSTVSPLSPGNDELAARIRVMEEELAALRLRQREAEMVATALVGGTVPSEQLAPLVRRLTEAEDLIMHLQAGRNATNVTTLSEQAALQVGQQQLQAETALLWQQLQRRVAELEQLSEETANASAARGAAVQKLSQRLTEAEAAARQMPASWTQQTEATLEQLAQQVTDLASQAELWVSSQQNQADTLTAAASTTAAAGGTLDLAALAQLQQDVSELQTQVGQLQQASTGKDPTEAADNTGDKADAGDQGVSQQVAVLTSEVESLRAAQQQQLDQLNTLVQDVEPRMARLQQQQEQQNLPAEAGTGVQQAEQRLAALEHALAQMEGLPSQMQGIQNLLDGIELKAPLGESVDKASAAGAGQGQLEVLEHRLEELGAALAEITSHQKQPRQPDTELAARLSELERRQANHTAAGAADENLVRRLSEVEQAIADLMRSQAENMADHAVTESSAELQALREQMQRLESDIAAVSDAAAAAQIRSGAAAANEQQEQAWQPWTLRIEGLESQVAELADLVQTNRTSGRLVPQNPTLETRPNTPESEEAWAVKTRELADKVAALEASVTGLQQKQPLTSLKVRISSTGEVQEERSSTGGRSGTAITSHSTSGGTGQAAAVAAAEAAASRLVAELRDAVFSKAKSGLVPREELESLVERVATLESAPSAISKEASPTHPPAAANGISCPGGLETIGEERESADSQPATRGKGADKAGDAGMEDLASEMADLRDAVFSKGTEGMVPRDEMMRALGAIATELTTRIKEVKHQIAEGLSAGNDSLSDGRSSDNTVMRMVAQSGIEMRRTIGVLQGHVDLINARLGESNPAEEIAYLREAMHHFESMGGGMGGGARPEHVMKLESKVEEVAGALVVVTERMNERMTALERSVVNTQTALSPRTTLMPAANNNQAMPPQSPSLAFGLGGSQEPQAFPQNNATYQRQRSATDNYAGSVGGGSDRSVPRASPPRQPLWPGTPVARMASQNEQESDRAGKEANAGDLLRPKSAREKVTALIAEKRQEVKRMQDQIKVDEERVKAQRAASAHRRTAEPTDEDSYALSMRPRTATLGGYSESSQAAMGRESSVRSVGFAANVSYGRDPSDLDVTSPKGPLTLDGPRSRGNSMGGMMVMNPMGQMQSISPARMAAMQQSMVSQQAMLKHQQQQQQSSSLRRL